MDTHKHGARGRFVLLGTSVALVAGLLAHVLQIEQAHGQIAGRQEEDREGHRAKHILREFD